MVPHVKILIDEKSSDDAMPADARALILDANWNARLVPVHARSE